jgi:hypothetical protein
MAVVSDSRKWMFVHVPKNGGLAVHDFLKPHLLAAGNHIVMESGAGAVFDGYGIEKHAKAGKLLGWMSGTGREWDEYKSFAVIREPTLRAQSVYLECKSQTKGMRERDAYWSRPGRGWWQRFDETNNVNDFILSGLYDPVGPFSITHTQHSFVSLDGDIIVKHLFPLNRMAADIPALLGLNGVVPIRHRRKYEKAGLNTEALLWMQRHFAIDYELAGQVGRGTL